MLCAGRMVQEGSLLVCSAFNERDIEWGNGTFVGYNAVGELVKNIDITGG